MSSTTADIPAQRAGGPAGQRHLGVALLVISIAQLMVVLDATIVNVALPSMAGALEFSNTGQQWIITAYSLAFGGFLLLGGRMGDLLGRRRVFLAGTGLFAVGSLLGGFAFNAGTLLLARAIQGVGAAIMAPTALALITTTFPEGAPRNKAMGVYAAMSGIGASVGLILGGVLTDTLGWRWVMFVNVPIAALLLALAPGALAESERQRGQFDVPGALLSTVGFASLVYGLTNGATDPTGVSHWGDTDTVVALVLAVLGIVGFFLWESRTRMPLMPFDVFKHKARAGAYAVSLCIGTAMFGLFFFLTLYVQEVLDYSPLKAGFAFLPFSAAIMVSAGLSANLVGRFGPRPFMLPGLALSAVGMVWFSRLDETAGFVTGLLPPMLVTAFGLGAVFVPLTIVAVTKIRDDEAGIASGVLNVGQQIGGSIGLAVIGTIAWSTFSTRLNNDLPGWLQGGGAPPEQWVAGEPPAALADPAYVDGFANGYLVAAAIVVLALAVTAAFVRVRKDEIGHTEHAVHVG